MIDDRVKSLITDVKAVLYDGAVTDSTYNKMVYNTAMLHGILKTTEQTVDSICVIYNLHLDEQIGITRKRGIEHEYVCLDDTFLPAEAERDIMAYEDFYNTLLGYVMMNLTEDIRVTHPQKVLFYEQFLMPWIKGALPERVRILSDDEKLVPCYSLFVAVLSRLKDEKIIKLVPFTLCITK